MFRTAYRLPFLAWVIGRNLALYIDLFELPIDAETLQGGLTPFVLGFTAAIGLFLSVLFHELGIRW